ncbi:MAG: archaeal heat shock protein Hsp20 [Ignisphaera sp.]|uniref:Hsp20/alpha crystallin family protein n=1 Tax=Ignisphaera aggregans TaxID=334771 RepID=A0A7C4JJ65_9CREN
MSEHEPERKRRKSIFDVFDDLFKELNEELNEFMNQVWRMKPFTEESIDISRKPIVYGFRIEIGPDGVPRIYEFGNVRRTPRGRVTVAEEREPLVDVYEEEDKIRVVAELPGVDEDKIKVRALDDKRIVIEASNHSRKYRKELELPVEVDVDSADAVYKNGVLEITFKKKSVERKSKEIKIKKS